ncbi:MAG: LemA family protein, partial [Coprobacillus sp.]|nr:LemA family protein [Coprobacillus sp.]
MANQLDELNGPTMAEGRDAQVIAKQIPIKTGWGSKFFTVMLWVLAIIPGLVFAIMRIRAGNHLRQLEQKINSNASEIDNYLEQRVRILENAAQLVNKAVKLDKETYTQIAALRSGNKAPDNPEDDATRNSLQSLVGQTSRSINVALERYPELQAHKEIRD